MKINWSIIFIIFSLNVSAQDFTFVDSLNYFNKKSFLINEYGFDGLGCNMTAENVQFTNGIMQLKLDVNHDTTKHKPFAYNSAGIEGIQYYKYGYFCTRMKSDIIKGSVSSFFLMTKWVPNEWIHREVDIEFLGKNLNAVQLTNHLIDTKTNNWQSASVTVPLPFSIHEDFHDYCILWTPDSVAWFADKKLLHVEKKFVPDEPMQILMNHWNADTNFTGTTQWMGGAINPKDLPSIASYDYITVQTLSQYEKSITDIKKKSENSTISISTNSASKYIEISSPINCTVTFTSISGTKLNSFKINEGVTMVDISTFETGIYFLTFMSEYILETKKLVLSKL